MESNGKLMDHAAAKAIVDALIEAAPFDIDEPGRSRHEMTKDDMLAYLQDAVRDSRIDASVYQTVRDYVLSTVPFSLDNPELFRPEYLWRR